MMYDMRSLIFTVFLGSEFVARGDVQQVGIFSSRDVRGYEVDAASRLLSPNNDGNSVPYIIGGTDVTDVGKYPFYVRLSIKQGESFFRCGGVLIAPDIVLSAAHCNYPNLDTTEITAIQGSLTDTGGTSSKCAQWINDPEYNDDALWSDYALCKLETPIIVDESSVSLQVNDDRSVPADDDTLLIIGFGTTETGSLSSTLKEVEVPAMSNVNCRGKTKTETYNYYAIDERHICAGYLEEDSGSFVDGSSPDACGGDSGGPLLRRNVVNGKTVYTHVGITSFGPSTPGCGYEGYPGVYARTSSRIDWIHNTACNDLNSVSSFCDNYSTPVCADGPELKISVRTDSRPEQNGWQLKVEEGTGYADVTRVHSYYNAGNEYTHRACLEYGKNYKWELFDRASDQGYFATSGGYCTTSDTCDPDLFPVDGIASGFCTAEYPKGCITVTNCSYSPGTIDSPCDCGTYESCGSMCSSSGCGSYSLTLDGSRIGDGTVNEDKFEYLSSQFLLTKTFSTPAELVVSPTAGPTASPTAGPTASPTAGPTAGPTTSASPTTSFYPSTAPTGSAYPSGSFYPSMEPSDTPSETAIPTESVNPSVSPYPFSSDYPSSFPVGPTCTHTGAVRKLYETFGEQHCVTGSSGIIDCFFRNRNWFEAWAKYTYSVVESTDIDAPQIFKPEGLSIGYSYKYVMQSSGMEFIYFEDGDDCIDSISYFDQIEYMIQNPRDHPKCKNNLGKFQIGKLAVKGAKKAGGVKKIFTTCQKIWDLPYTLRAEQCEIEAVAENCPGICAFIECKKTFGLCTDLHCACTNNPRPFRKLSKRGARPRSCKDLKRTKTAVRASRCADPTFGNNCPRICEDVSGGICETRF